MTLDEVSQAAGATHLAVFGAFHDNKRTVVLLGPKEPGFWAAFSASPEYNDGLGDPLDRWSTRVVGALAGSLGATSAFPFGGPPFQPFIDWAKRSGRAWASPVGLLVHDTAGLMISYRGALLFDTLLELPATAKRPCDTCSKPCITACPVGALTPNGYDVATCKAYVASGSGRACRLSGCAVRRSCPVSQSYGRLPEQSAFHMEAFL